MITTGRKSQPAKKAEQKSKAPPPPPAADEDYEDGDICSPKRDRDGNDDEPL